jgi:outer membrane protein OmpA-like peptidoglycan-associated protein
VLFSRPLRLEKYPGGERDTLALRFCDLLRFHISSRAIDVAHADSRGTAEYNKGLTERRVERTRHYLVEHGVPAGHLETRSFGDENPLTTEQIKEQVAKDPELTESDGRQMLSNLREMVLANKRRVDVSLNTTGQQSTHRYPFNAQAYLALISLSATGTGTANH